VHVAYSRGSVLLWKHRSKLCASGFVDDITFSRTGPYGAGDTSKASADSDLSGVESGVYDCLVFFVFFPFCVTSWFGAVECSSAVWRTVNILYRIVLYCIVPNYRLCVIYFTATTLISRHAQII